MDTFDTFLNSIAGRDTASTRVYITLFIVPNAALREAFIIQLLNEAGKMGLCPIYRSSDNTVLMDNSEVAVVKIAYPKLDEWARGLVFDQVYGADVLLKYDNGKDMIANIEAQIR